MAFYSIVSRPSQPRQWSYMSQHLDFSTYNDGEQRDSPDMSRYFVPEASCAVLHTAGLKAASSLWAVMLQHSRALLPDPKITC